MPELPEAEVIARRLQADICGTTIQRIWIGREDIVREGRMLIPWFRFVRIEQVERYGKSIVLVCVNQSQERRFLLAELGMTGLFLFHHDKSYDKHIHMVLTLQGGQQPELRYWNPRRFGRVYAFDREGLEKFCRRRFGPDPLVIRKEDFIGLVKNFRGRIKTLLLQQPKISGIGNIYANEILYFAGIHPHARGRNLSKKKIAGLHFFMRKTLEHAIEKGGSTIRDFRAPDGSVGQYQYCHQVYHKAGSPCPKGCFAIVRCLVTERSSFFCPSCQKRA